MRSRKLAAVALGAMFMAASAHAQTPAAPAPTPPPLQADASSPSSAHAGEWRISKIVGLTVFNADNDTLGTINDVLTDNAGKITAIVIGVGGFLGVGEHLVAVPFDMVKFSMDPLVKRPSDAATDSAKADSAKSGPKTDASKAAPKAVTVPADAAKAGAATDAAAQSTADARTPGVDPWVPNHAVLNATKDQLKAMTEFKYTR